MRPIVWCDALNLSVVSHCFYEIFFDAQEVSIQQNAMRKKILPRYAGVKAVARLISDDLLFTLN